MRRSRSSVGVLASLAATTIPVHSAVAAPMSLSEYMALSGPAPTRHIAYGPDPSQFVELFEPAGRGPFPVAVLIHGGCFKSEFEGVRQMRGMAGALVSRGIAVWNVEYRRLDEAGGGYPGTFQDAAAAIDLLGARRTAYRLDTRRLVVVGHSAGGYLALWSAGRGRLPVASPIYKPSPMAVREVISLGADGDLRPHAAIWKQVCGLDLAQLTGAPSLKRPNVDEDTTPIELTPNGSHTVLINGEFDTLSPPAQARVYAARVRRAGDRLETVILPGASHFDEVAVSSPSWGPVLARILKALRAGP